MTRLSGAAAVACLLLWSTLACGRAGTAGRATPARDANRAPATVRVLVLNMHAGKDAGGADNLPRVAALVRDVRADLVLLQEVDSLTRRSGGVDQASELARLTGMAARFGNALAFQGGGYGIATLSRLPVRDARLVRLPVDPPQERSGGSREPRGVLVVEVELGGRTLHVLNTHLDPSGDDRWRRQESDSVVQVALRLATGGTPVLVGGDLNAEPDSRVIASVRAAGLRDLWAECGSGTGLTFPAAAPVKRIDYLLSLGSVSCASARVVDDDLSDHRGVLMEVRVR